MILKSVWDYDPRGHSVSQDFDKMSLRIVLIHWIDFQEDPQKLTMSELGCRGFHSCNMCGWNKNGV